MNAISIIIIFTRFLFLLVLGVIGFLVQYRRVLLREKSSAYECGLDPNKSARVPLSLRFLLLAVIFLVFDVEIALLVGVPVSLNFNFHRTVVRRTVFLFVLISGLLHEWREGSLNWA